MNSLLDNLFARRPKIHYVCPAICGLQFVPTSSGTTNISIDSNTLNCVNYAAIGNTLQWDPYPEAICYNVYMAPAPARPDDGLPPCVAYHLVNTTSLSSQFTWDPYPDATSYNVYRAFASDPTRYVKTQSNIPVSTLSIDNEHVIVTAVTPSFETPTCQPIYYVSNCATEVENWVARVVANGGATPPEWEQVALCDFITALKAAALWDRIYSLNHFSPSSKTAAAVWVKKGLMADSFSWNNPALEASRTTGLDGFYPAGDYVDTGVLANSIYSQQNCGVTGYASKVSAEAPTDILGAFCGAYDAPNDFALHPWKRSSTDPVFGYTQGSCWTLGGVFGVPATNQEANKGCGYVSMNRIGLGSLRIYYGASNSPHSLIAEDTVSSTDTTTPASGLRLFSDVAQSNLFHGYCSFLALHEGFNEADSATLFGLVQAFRVAIGGGYV